MLPGWFSFGETYVTNIERDEVKDASEQLEKLLLQSIPDTAASMRLYTVNTLRKLNVFDS